MSSLYQILQTDSTYDLYGNFHGPIDPSGVTLSGDVTGPASATVVAHVPNEATSATTANTDATIVLRDTTNGIGLPGLDVTGNLQFIQSGGAYNNISMSGGNSVGYLWSNFPANGDSINLGYNFYVPSPGTTPLIPNNGGPTSRIRVGYGMVGIYAGTTNVMPVEYIRINSDATVTMMNSALLVVPNLVLTELAALSGASPLGPVSKRQGVLLFTGVADTPANTELVLTFTAPITFVPTIDTIFSITQMHEGGATGSCLVFKDYLIVIVGSIATITLNFFNAGNVATGVGSVRISYVILGSTPAFPLMAEGRPSAMEELVTEDEQQVEDESWTPIANGDLVSDAEVLVLQPNPDEEEEDESCGDSSSPITTMDEDLGDILKEAMDGQRPAGDLEDGRRPASGLG